MALDGIIGLYACVCGGGILNQSENTDRVVVFSDNFTTTNNQHFCQFLRGQGLITNDYN